MVTIIDYEAGNIGSIANMIYKLGTTSIISKNYSDIASAEKLILPGVGKFDFGMSKLTESGLIDLLNKKVLEDRIPILGICLGAQLMTKKSEEGNLSGLGWFDAEVKKFSFTEGSNELRIPHMGWNYVDIKKETALSKGLPVEAKFYFVHSYYLQPCNSEDVFMTTHYGNDFVSGLNHNNIYALQFHPEKSHKYGLKIFQNFLSI